MRRWLGVLWLVAACSRASAEAPVAFIDNDYAGALTEARRLHVPLLVDAWAPWCHTCLSMRAVVFPDPALRVLAKRFVWLAIDTERSENAVLVDRLGVRSLPTILVIDAASEQPVASWSGSLTAPELVEWLSEALSPATSDSGVDAAQALLQRARRESASGRGGDAERDLRAALSTAAPDWADRAAALDALVTELGQGGREDECLRVSQAAVPAMPPGTARLDVLRTGIGCGLNLPSGDPSRARLEPLASLGERIASDDGQAALADDRSDLFDDVVSAWQALGRLEDAKRVALVWAAFVEREAGLAASPASRAVFDAHRVAASIAAGDPQRALEPLERSERDFPGDYNPPARLGRVLMALGRYGEADAALSRALALAYGPRRLNLGSTLADVRLARGDRSGARRALESALASAGGTPLPGSYPKLRDALAQRLAELSP